MEAFGKAIEESITAINTGTLYDRNGLLRSGTGKGKLSLSNANWRSVMDQIVDLLAEIQARYQQALSSGELVIPNPCAGNDDSDFYYIREHSDLPQWMDNARSRVLALFSSICVEAGLQPLIFRATGRRW